MKNIKKSLLLYSLMFIICGTSFSQPKPEEFLTKKIVETVPIQEKYDGLTDVVPAFVMMQTSFSSMISQELADEIQDRIYRAMIETEKLKPVLLNKWLLEKYGLTKAKNIFSFINSLSDERYPCNAVGICHPYIFQTNSGYLLMIAFYRFSDKGYPITVVRNIKSLSECSAVISAMLDEYIKITTENTDKLFPKKRIIIKPFVLESRKYIGQNSGEFDYIPSTFIEQDGVIIKATDDFYSRLFAYSLYTTQMIQAVPTIDMGQFIETSYLSSENTDFYIEGKIQLTDQINIYHITLYNSKNGHEIKSIKYFSSDFSIEGLWETNMNLVYSLADYIWGTDGYGVVPDVDVPGQGMFLNNVFLGWDRLRKCVLPKGKHIIYTGDYYSQNSNVEIKNKNRTLDVNGNIYRSFFIYLDDRNWLFRGKDGERVWNLLEK